MINQKENPVEWALLVMELDEAKDHLESLSSAMAQSGNIEEPELEVRLFHAITHLNRIWNLRNHSGEVSPQDFEKSSKKPTEFKQVG